MAGVWRSGPAQECVPYARTVSGIQIYGDAYTWWESASGLYPRGQRPEPGAVLVLARSSKLRHGHLAVVVAVDGPRQIRVTHANWGWDGSTRRRVYEAMPVTDVSPANDWTQLRFFNYDTGAFGQVYPGTGFIYPPGRVS